MSKSCKKFILTICMVAFCVVIVKISCNTAYAEAIIPSGDYLYGAYGGTTAGSFGNGPRLTYEAGCDLLASLTVGVRPMHQVVSSSVGNVYGYDYYSFSDNTNLLYVSGFSFVSYDSNYYVIRFMAKPSNQSTSSSSIGYYLTDTRGRYYRVEKEAVYSSYIDQIEGRLARTVNDITYTVADSTYNTWRTLESMSGTLTSIAARMLCYTDSGVVNTVAESAYWSFAYQKYTYNRLSDVISAIESIGVTSVTLDGVQLNVDSSNISLWNNNAYCCGYRVTVDDVPYETLEIPYDTATAIVARLNTDYVGQGVTLLSRDGTTYTRYVRSATILPDGYIRVKLTNGYNYYLCDNVNVLYVVDMNSNYGSRIESLLTDKLASIQNVMTDTKDSMVSRLDVIIENLEGIRANSEITVVQQVQQHSDDVNSGLDSVGQILILVREFFNPGIETDWGEARNYAMNWGNDE